MIEEESLFLGSGDGDEIKKLFKQVFRRHLQDRICSITERFDGFIDNNFVKFGII